MKEKNLGLLLFGIFNAISVFPFLFLVMILALITKLNIFTGLLALFIILLSPISCILGIVQGIRYWKMARVCAPTCFILSIIGLILFAVVTGYIWYLIPII